MNKAAAAAAAELAHEVLMPTMAVKSTPDQHTDADTGEGIENFSDPDWVDKYIGDATQEQLAGYAAILPPHPVVHCRRGRPIESS